MQFAQGIHKIDAEQYHQDPCPEPSLSCSVLQIVLNESLLHAWHAHPRLNPGYTPDTSRRSEIGSVTHKLALGAGADVAIIDADSYRTNAAKEAREAALQARKIPCLRADYERAEALAVPLREAVEAYVGERVEQCLVERVVVWQERGQWRRCMIDIMTPDLRRVADLKSTQASAAPLPSSRRIYDSGYHIQAAWYLRALDAVDPDNTGRREFGFLFGEQGAPYAVSPPIELSEAGLEMARQQIEVGVALWDNALRSGQWPGYSGATIIAEPPSWALTQWQLRYETDETLNPQARTNGAHELEKLRVLAGMTP